MGNKGTRTSKILTIKIQKMQREYLNYILFFRAKNRRFRRNINVGGKKKDGTEGSRI